MITIKLLRKTTVYVAFAFLCFSTARSQTPVISAPATITFTQGVENTPVVISNSGGAIPNTLFGKPEVVPTTGNVPYLRPLVKSSNGSFYGGVQGTGTYSTTALHKIAPDGTVSVYAGSTSEGYIDGPLASARFMNIINLAADSLGNLYLTELNTTDNNNSRIRKVSSDGIVSTFATGLKQPQGIAIDASGSIYVVEASWIRKYNPDGTYTIFAGKIGPGYENGQGTNASFTNPDLITFHKNGNLYVHEDLYQLRMITPSGLVSHVGSPYPVKDGMCIDAGGNYWMRSGSGMIQLISPIPNGFSSVPITYGAGAITLVGDYIYFTYENKFQRMAVFGYAVEPTLPSGVTLNANGTISGSPQWLQSPIDYTIKAHNVSGNSSTVVKYSAIMQALHPTITSFTPIAAVRRSTITISGTHLLGATSVSIGGVPVESFQVFPDKITAVMAPETPSGEIKVTNPHGSGTMGGFTLIPPPIVTSFSPSSAMNGGVIIITGENFTNIDAVWIGNSSATSFKVISTTTIEATVGRATDGTVTVSSDAGSGSKNGFVFIPPPLINSFTPKGGLGSEISINGAGFSGATSVKFGPTEATSFIIESATSIKAIVGKGSSGDISITTPAGTGTKSGFTWVEAPQVTSVYPLIAKTGDNISILGSNLLDATVFFGGVPATTVNSSLNSVLVRVGAGASGDITITTPGGTTTKPGFIFLETPSIISFSPTSGRKGDIITIAGTNFKADTKVTFGSTPAQQVKILSSTSIEATIGSGASGSVTVLDVGGTGSKTGFIHTGPKVNNVSPLTGGVGTSIAITGLDFSNVTGVSFGGIPAASYTVNSSNSITAIAGKGQSGFVSVITDYGTAYSNSNFLHSGPSISFTNSNLGYAGLKIILTGTRFTGVQSVSFGGVPAASFTVISDNRIDAILGTTGASGDVVVESPTGLSSISGFSYLPPPTITSISPDRAGYQERITITGANFHQISVKIGTTTVFPDSYTATSIVITVPENATDENIILTTPAGSVSSGMLTHTGPKISAFTPATAPAGHTVTITGQNFTGVTEVSFGTYWYANPVVFSIVSDTEIKATLPSYAGPTLTVKSPKGSSSMPGFTFINPTAINSFTPQRAGAGIPVTISGGNFIQVSSVTFGGVPAESFMVKSSSEIVAIPGSGASGNVEVTAIAGKASKPEFLWYPKPIITSFYPTKAATGDTVTIKGKNLLATFLVKFGNTLWGGLVSASDSVITVKVAGGESGELTVGTPGGTTSVQGFIYIQPPTINSFTVSGEGNGATVVITGTNLADVSAVKFGTMAASSFIVNSATEITAIAGFGESGEVTVITAGGLASKTGYIHYKPPYIASFSPASGPAGTILTITGANFNSSAENNKVYFGSMRAKVVAATITELKVTVPPGASNSPIRVLNAGNKMTGFSLGIFRLTYPQPNPAPQSLYPYQTDLPLQDLVSSAQIVDLDDDGRNDLVVTSGSSNGITFLSYRNTLSDGLSAGSFQASTLFEIKPLNSVTYALGDVNGDGLTDIVCSIPSKIIIFKNISTVGNITFNADTVASGYWGLEGPIIIQDLDLDGKCDILANGVFRRNTSSFAAGSALSFANPQPVINSTSGGSYTNPAWQDLDGDRKLDVVMSGSYGDIKVARNTSVPGLLNTSSFQEQVGLPSILYNNTLVYATDIDGDNKPEVLETSGSSYFTIMQNNHSSGRITEASFSAPRQINLFLPYGVNPLFNDLDGDAKPDIVFASNSSVKMFKNSGTSGSYSFSEKTLFSTGNYPGAVNLSSVAIGDLDGDGKPEVITTNSTNYKTIILHSNPNKSPEIMGFSPMAAAVGATVTISGRNLSNTTAVSFGGQPAASFKVTSDGTITAVVGTGASGDVTLLIGGATFTKAGFSLATLPSFSSFSPTVATQGTVITITGTNFNHVAGITFGGKPAASFQVVSPTSITAIVGQGASGDLSISSAAGNVFRTGFTFIPKPQIQPSGQTTFASGGSVQLTAIPANGYTYTWRRNGTIVPGSTSANLIASETGSYSVTIGSSSVESESTPVSVMVVYALPPTNFKVQLTSESCKKSNNGVVMISTLQEEDYTATIKGNNKNVSYPFRSSKEITDLSAGEYEICITVAGQPDFSRCFNVIVTEPEDFSFISSVDNRRNTINLKMSGSELYTIELNGKTYQTANTDIELPLISGSNILSVWTDKDCQGKITRNIELHSTPMVYPNPFEKELFVAAKQGESAKIEVRNLEGKLLYTGIHKSENGSYSIILERLSPGIYLLQISSERSINTYKIIKR